MNLSKIISEIRSSWQELEEERKQSITQERVFSGIERIVSAQSDEEIEAALKEYSELLEPENIKAIGDMMSRAEQEGDSEAVAFFGTAFMLLITFGKDYKTKTSIEKIAPTVAWAISARKYIATRKTAFLKNAIEKAQNIPKIVEFLRLVPNEKNMPEYSILAKELMPSLKEEGRFEEAYTIELLSIHELTSYVEKIDEATTEQREAITVDMLNICEQSLRLSLMLTDEPCYAMYSGMFGTYFWKRRNPGMADYYFKNALKIYRKLGNQEPENFGHFLLKTLHNLGNVQISQRHVKQAESMFSEALDGNRDFAARYPESYKLELVMSLSSLANLKHMNGKSLEAEELFREAIVHCRPLVEENFEANGEYLAMALNNFSNVLGRLNKLAEAEKIIDEALQIYRKLVILCPQYFDKDVALALNSLARIQRANGNLKEAERSLEESLSIYRNLARQDSGVFNEDLVKTLRNLGVAKRELGKLEEAIRLFREAAEILRNLAKYGANIHGDDLADVLAVLANVYEEINDSHNAAECRKEALKIRKTSTNQNSDDGNALNSLLSNLVPQVPWAIKAREFLVLKGEKGNFARKKAMLEAIDQGETEIADYLGLFINYNNPEIVERANNIFSRLQEEGRIEEALTVYLLMLDTQVSYLVLADRYSPEEQSQVRELGTNACLEAARVSAILKDKACQAFYLGLIAEKFRDYGETQRAIDYYNEVLELYRELNEQNPNTYKLKLADFLVSLGVLQSKQNLSEEAEKSYTEALEYYRELDKQNPNSYNEGIADALTNLGREQYARRNLLDAEKNCEEALILYRELAEQGRDVFPSLALVLNNLGAAQNDLGKRDDAEKSHAEAFRIRTTLGAENPDKYNRDLAQTLSNLSAQALDAGELERAEKYGLESLEIYRKLNEQNSQDSLNEIARALTNLGPIRAERGHLADAERFLDEALEIRRELVRQNPNIFDEGFAETLNNSAQVQFLKKDYRKALKNLEEAKEFIEDLIERAITPGNRIRMIEQTDAIYEGLLICHFRLGNWEKALEIAEIGKSRSLTDFLNLKSEDLMPKSAPSDAWLVRDLKEKHSHLVNQLRKKEIYEHHLNQNLFEGKQTLKIFENSGDTDSSMRALSEEIAGLDSSRKTIKTEISHLQSQLRKTIVEIKKYDPNFPPEVEQISSKKILEIVTKTNRTAVIFRVLRDLTLLIFVFPNGKIHIEEVSEFNQGKLLNLYYRKWFRPYQLHKEGIIDDKKWKASIDEMLDTLYAELMAHVHRIIEKQFSIRNLFSKLSKKNSGGRELLFIPNLCLALLPLHATSWKDENDEKKYFLDSYTISYAPSLSVFDRCLKNDTPRTNKALFISNPGHDRRFTEKTIDDIIGLKIHHPYADLRGADVSKSAVVRNLSGDNGFVHFSCHAFYDLNNPFDSGLILSNGEVLNLSDIINSDLNNNWLTILAGCETALVDFETRTDNHFGLPLGFIFAGVPSIWASLWSVKDWSTYELMTEAYRQLDKSPFKDNKPEALRQAQIEIRKKFPHPIYWAGFQHFGV